MEYWSNFICISIRFIVNKKIGLVKHSFRSKYLIPAQFTVHLKRQKERRRRRRRKIMQAPEQYMLYAHHLYISSYHWLRAVMHTFLIWFILLWKNKRKKIKEKRDSAEHSRQGRENRKKRGKAKEKEARNIKRRSRHDGAGLGESQSNNSLTHRYTLMHTHRACVTHMSERRANPCWRLITGAIHRGNLGIFFPLLSHLTDTHLCLRDARLGRCSTTYNPACTFHNGCGQTLTTSI